MLKDLHNAINKVFVLQTGNLMPIQIENYLDLIRFLSKYARNIHGHAIILNLILLSNNPEHWKLQHLSNCLSLNLLLLVYKILFKISLIGRASDETGWIRTEGR